MVGTKVFISYSHRQGQGVWDRPVPCLKAGGTELLIDRDRFEAGKAVVGQMDNRHYRKLISIFLDFSGLGYRDPSFQ